MVFCVECGAEVKGCQCPNCGKYNKERLDALSEAQANFFSSYTKWATRLLVV